MQYRYLFGQKDCQIKEVSVQQQKVFDKTINVDNTKIQNRQFNQKQENKIDNQLKIDDMNQKDCYETSINRLRLLKLEQLILEIIPVQTGSLTTLYFESNYSSADAGIALFDKKKLIKEITSPLGKQKINVAEFLALFFGIRCSLNLRISFLECSGDNKALRLLIISLQLME